MPQTDKHASDGSPSGFLASRHDRLQYVTDLLDGLRRVARPADVNGELERRIVDALQTAQRLQKGG